LQLEFNLGVRTSGMTRKKTTTDGAVSPSPGASANFAGFPRRTALEAGDIPIEDLAGLALREGQATSPLFRVHRWFARRLGSQFRAMLTGLSLCADEAEDFWDRFLGHIPLDNAVALDPFVGGGTSVSAHKTCNEFDAAGMLEMSPLPKTTWQVTPCVGGDPRH
jgi:hypothetical protein